MGKKCKTEVFARVTGFFQPTGTWNPGKVQEFKDRKKFDRFFKDVAKSDQLNRGAKKALGEEKKDK